MNDGGRLALGRDEDEEPAGEVAEPDEPGGDIVAGVQIVQQPAVEARRPDGFLDFRHVRANAGELA
jgi:hypothetical protein